MKITEEEAQYMDTTRTAVGVASVIVLMAIASRLVRLGKPHTIRDYSNFLGYGLIGTFVILGMLTIVPRFMRLAQDASAESFAEKSTIVIDHREENLRSAQDGDLIAWKSDPAQLQLTFCQIVAIYPDPDQGQVRLRCLQSGMALSFELKWLAREIDRVVRRKDASYQQALMAFKNQ